MQEAMEWLQHLGSEDSTDHDVAEWLSWYGSDAHNRQAFDEMRDFWLQTGRLTAVAGFDAWCAAERQRMGAQVRRPVRSVWSVLRRAWYSGEHAWSWRRAGVTAAAAVLLLFMGVVSVRLWSERQLRTATVSAAGVSMVRHAQLPDGSAVDLAPDSVLAIEFTPGERTIDLQRGEAFFSVAPNRSRPFIVKALGLRVRALGTEFNVRQSLSRVTVTVTEGIVDVYGEAGNKSGSSSASPAPGGNGLLRLSAGNQVVWDERTGERTVRATEPERAVAWRTGRLEYIDEPLAAVVSDVNRYGSRQIDIREQVQHRKQLRVGPANVIVTHENRYRLGGLSQRLAG